jgi:hypothetical protein
MSQSPEGTVWASTAIRCKDQTMRIKQEITYEAVHRPIYASENTIRAGERAFNRPAYCPPGYKSGDNPIQNPELRYPIVDRPLYSSETAMRAGEIAFGRPADISKRIPLNSCEKSEAQSLTRK